MKSHIKIIFIVCVIAGLPISETFALYPVQSHHAQTHGKDNKNISFNYSYEYEEAEHTNDTTKTQEYDTILGYGLTDDLDIVNRTNISNTRTRRTITAWMIFLLKLNGNSLIQKNLHYQYIRK